jgi:hypothetical protein
MDRSEHLALCKKRALEYLDQGDLMNAVTSMGSDMSKHPETGISPVLWQLGTLHLINHDALGVRRWIEGFR